MTGSTTSPGSRSTAPIVSWTNGRTSRWETRSPSIPTSRSRWRTSNLGAPLSCQGHASVDGHPPYDFTWALVLSDAADATRLIVRERYAYTGWWVRLLV